MITIDIVENPKLISLLMKEWTGKDYDDSYNTMDSHFVVAKDNGDCVGCVQMIMISDPYWNRKWGLVENVYVAKGYRRKGIAGKMMSAVANLCRDLGCSFLKLTSGKEEGKALYRSLGYQEGSSFRKELQ